LSHCDGLYILDVKPLPSEREVNDVVYNPRPVGFRLALPLPILLAREPVRLLHWVGVGMPPIMPNQ
jgi:hypothetical protein